MPSNHQSNCAVNDAQASERRPCDCGLTPGFYKDGTPIGNADDHMGLNSTLQWCGYRIEHKRDFGHYHRAKGTRGYVVVKNGCNAMPAAAWFGTIPEAKRAIAALELSKLIVPNETLTWSVGSDSSTLQAHAFWMVLELTRK